MTKKVHIFILATLLFIMYGVTNAHRGEMHGPSDQAQVHPSANIKSFALKEIGEQYESQIKPIFIRACFDCHSSKTRYPWYAKLPLLKRVIDEDINEGREHLDLSHDFPFKSHATPNEDLEEIQRVIKEKEMPPFRYWIVHWDAKLNDSDRRKITDWTKQSLTRLEQ